MEQKEKNEKARPAETPRERESGKIGRQELIMGTDGRGASRRGKAHEDGCRIRAAYACLFPY